MFIKVLTFFIAELIIFFTIYNIYKYYKYVKIINELKEKYTLVEEINKEDLEKMTDIIDNYKKK